MASRVLGYSNEGRPIRAVVVGSGARTYLACGVVHGNEPLGGTLLERFARTLAASPGLTDGLRVVVVPVLNPDGLELGTRTNARGIDLNRNFPARNWSPDIRHGKYPGSEPETQALLSAMREYVPRRVLAVHSPLHCVNFDGPAEELAQRMAAAVDYPLRYSIGYPTPGSLGCFAGLDMRLPTVTLELRRYRSVDEAWSEVEPALRAFLE